MKKVVFSIVLTILMFLSSNQLVDAANLKANIQIEEEQIRKNQEITVDVRLEDFEDINRGINSYKATIEYDKDVFEEIDTSNFQVQNNWIDLKYNRENGEFISINKVGTKNGELVVQITLRVREGAKAGMTTITIKDIVTSEGNEDIEVDTASDQVEVIRLSTDEETSAGSTSTSEAKEDTKVDKKINYIAIIGVIVFVLIAIYSFRKQSRVKKNKEKKRFWFIVFVLSTLLALTLTLYTIFNSINNKGKVNDDQKINYTDVELLQFHLIDLETIPEDKLNNADMNNDGKITITDLSLLIRGVENKTEYTVTITDSDNQDYYPVKGSEITLYFKATVTDEEEIKEVTISNQVYSVQKINQDGLSAEYKVVLPRENEAGIKEYQFTKVLLKNNKEVNVDYKIEVDVLKDIPVISNYTVKEDIAASKLHISFSLKDTDSAITDSRYEIIDSKQNILKEGNLSTGTNKISIDVEKKEVYYLNIYANYNLDSALLPIQKDNTGTIQENYKLQLVSDYDFTLNNIKTYKNGVNTSVFEIGDVITIRFNSANNTEYYPNKIKINGKYYKVTKNKSNFEVSIKETLELGNHTFNIEEAVLNNGKSFELDKKVTVEIVKRTPNVTDFDYQENIETSKLNIKFTLNDLDEGLVSAKVVLLDSDSKKISEEEITSGEVDITFDTKMTDTYIVQVIADYNLSDKYQYENKLIYEKKISAEARAEITNVDASKIYPTKLEEINLTYKINTNKKSDVTYIIINSVQYKATKQSDGSYKVTLKLGQNSGLLELKTTNVIFKDEAEAKVSNTTQIDVLKDAPKVENYQYEDLLDDAKVRVTFDLVDADNSFLGGKVWLVKKEDNSKVEETLKVGTNTYEFSVENLKEYELKVIATYDLDSNTLDSAEVNRILNEEIYNKEIVQIADYQLSVSNIKTYNEKEESKYFIKDEAVKLQFTSTNISDFYPVKAVIAGKEYELIKNGNTYTTALDGYQTSGVKEITIEKIILSNDKELTLKDNNKVSVEVLKEMPLVNNFKYQEDSNSNIEISFEVIDSDNSINSLEVIVYDDKKDVVLKESAKTGTNSKTFATSASEEYTVYVLGTFDLDTNSLENGKNEYANYELLKGEINLGARLIQMKDIQNISLYKEQDNDIELLTKVDIKDLDNLNNYLVKVDMKDMTSFYTTIKEYKVENNTLKLTLDYDNIVHYDGDNKINELIVNYGGVEDDVAYSGSIEALIKEIEANPSGTFTLTQDLNADILTPGNTLIDSDIVFTGVLDGNGYTIYNLNKPLFNQVDGAVIENLVIEDSVIASPGRGLIANEVRNVTSISNVHAKNITINSSTSETGTLVGTMKSSSIIRNCSATNITITSSGKRTGGLVGAMASSMMSNCYVNGNITSTQDGVGGITGYAQNVTISNSYSVVNLSTTTGPSYNGGFVGHSDGVKIVNSLSLATGEKARRFIGTGSFNNGSGNNYELDTSTLESNTSSGVVNTVSLSEIQTVQFYQNKLSFDEDIWDYTNVTQGTLPTLKNLDPNYELNKEYTLSSDNLYIPDYNRLKNMNDYNQQKEIIYHNLYKLMPFYDAKYLVIYGNNIDINNELNKKLIKYVIALDENNEQVLYLTIEDYKQIKKIKVIFEDDTTTTYDVTYNSYYGNVASYKIDTLDIYYNFNKYVVNIDAAIIDTLVSYVESLDYTENLDPLTSESDSRLYRDYYNEVTKKDATNFILKLLSNNDAYTVIVDNKVLNKKIENELITQDRIKEITYAYNYYERWYNFKIGGLKVSDIVLFNGELFNPTMNVDNMVNEVLNGNRQTGSTHTFYANSISKYTGYSNIGSFLDYIIGTIGGYTDVNDWFTQNYQGIVYEVGVEGRPDIEYRAWRNLKRRDNFLLPFLTLPENSAYIISSPTQFLVGAQRTYIIDPSDEEQRLELVKRITDYGNRIDTFYTTASGFVPAQYLNANVDIQVDHRFTKNESGASQIQDPNTTEEPFHKNFNEAVNYWASSNGSAAYATGSNVYWVAYSALSDFYTWSHETGHNQDSKVFLQGNGRRPSGWAEDYADGNTAQGFGDGEFNFNLSATYNLEDTITTNLTPERINSTEKIDSYYKGMFETSDFLDYIEAKAFLTLTPEEQAKVAVQVYYPNKEGLSEEEQNVGDEITGFRILTAEDFEKMNLKTVEDLWDNKIIIKPGITGTTTYGTNRYGADNIYTRHWYQQHNDNGRPDSYALKQLAWEMLGYAGYENGYVVYYSGRSKTDLEAIRTITGDSTMTWKQYKMNRYAYMEEKWNDMTYIDADAVLNQYIEALKIDASKGDRNVTASTNVKRINYHYLKRVTNDFEEDIFNKQIDIIHITNASELKEKVINNPGGYFVLDNDIDVSSLTGETSLINVTFIGNLDGKGHKITGLTLPLFEKVKFSNISNLIIDGADITLNDSHVGALTRTMDISTLNNVHIINATINGTSRTGAIVGYVTNSIIKECSANATVVGTGNAIGGFVGELNRSIALNSYSLGSIKGNLDIGGFTGWSENSYIANSFSGAYTESTNHSAGGFIGQATGNTKLQNNISFASVKNGYKFDGRTSSEKISQFTNNYEYEEVLGASTLNRTGIDFTNRITVVNDNEVLTLKFYTDTLLWSDSIWDFTNVTNGYFPKLKNNDPNKENEIVERIEISSLEDFLKISDAPDKNYVLTKDIDFTNCTETDSVIKVTFTGKIDGKGYTLSNLNNAALFANFRGTAQNIKIKDFKYENENQDFVAAFAKQTYGATIKNIYMENITLSGHHNVAPLTGMDGRENANSVFEKITVKNANVKGSGYYVSAFVGRKFGGVIKDVYVEGNMEVYTTETGGIVGATHQNIQISNVISNVNINRPKSTDDRNQNGGFIGNIYDTPTIQNSVVIGNMTGFTDTDETYQDVDKFTGATEDKIIATLINCFEVKERTGQSGVTDNTSSALNEIEEVKLTTEDFYKNTLKFDATIWDFSTISTKGYPTLKH